MSGLEDWKYRYLKIQETWENMTIKQWINANPGLVFAAFLGSVLLFLIVIVVMLIGGGQEPAALEARYAWYYDLNTGSVFMEQAGRVPPVRAPSGKLPDGSRAGVLAYLFVRETSEGISEPFIGYLETRDKGVDEEQYLMAKQLPGDQWGTGVLVRTVDDPTWYPLNSEQGYAISMKYWKSTSRKSREVIKPHLPRK